MVILRNQAGIWHHMRVDVNTDEAFAEFLSWCRTTNIPVLVNIWWIAMERNIAKAKGEHLTTLSPFTDQIGVKTENDRLALILRWKGDPNIILSY